MENTAKGRKGCAVTCDAPGARATEEREDDSPEERPRVHSLIVSLDGGFFFFLFFFGSFFLFLSYCLDFSVVIF